MAIAIRMPQLGMIMTEGTLSKWFKDSGGFVNQGQGLAEITTEKITYELEAPESGIFHPIVEEGEVVPIEALIAYILQDGESLPDNSVLPIPVSFEGANAKLEPSVGAQSSRVEGLKAAPNARKLAARLQIDISRVVPARPGARIVEADVQAYADKKEELNGVMRGFPKPSKTEVMAGVRKIIAGNMKQSLSDSAQLSFHIEVNINDASAMRKDLSRSGDITLSITDVMLKACADALSKIPQINTVLSGEKVYFFDKVNIGLAVAVEHGLVVPVLKDVQQKSLSQIAVERNDLVKKAKQGKLMPDELVGGTFTLTVLGIVDGFTPILNPGQSAILGVGRVNKKPVVVGDEIVVREMVSLSLTVDHQVVDGVPAVNFLRRLKQTLEMPNSLFK